MPGFITHYLCAQAVVGRLPTEMQQVLAPYKNIYNIGAQGPDIFFYYLPGLLKKRTKGIGQRIHQENAGGIIVSMADVLREIKKKDEQAILFAYISGFLTHYALDASAHPYVYARTSINHTAMLNRAAHRKLETAIDVLMLKLLSGEQPSQYKLWQLINADARQIQPVAAAMSAAIKSVYNQDVQAAEVHKAMRYMIRLTRILQSNKGRRKQLMELVESVTLGTPLFSSLIHMQMLDDTDDYLNLKNEGESFLDLYQAAVDSATAMTVSLYDFISGGRPRDQLIKTIGNRSLKTGQETGFTLNLPTAFSFAAPLPYYLPTRA